jgi:hypothetical protein
LISANFCDTKITIERAAITMLTERFFKTKIMLFNFSAVFEKNIHALQLLARVFASRDKTKNVVLTFLQRLKNTYMLCNN